MKKTLIIKIIPQSEQRHLAQWGDYWEEDDAIQFRITDMGNDNYTMAILLHELWEKYRNDQSGITDKAVDVFDATHPELDEPGRSLDAPYHGPHVEAELFERLALQLTGEDVTIYDNIGVDA